MAKTILIADDSENDAIVLRETLRTTGIRNPAIVVGDGSDVLAYFKGEEKYADRKRYPLPGILILDLKMPRVGGFEVMKWLQDQKEYKDTLVVVLSGLAELQDIRRAYQLGARSFLKKPCEPADVLNLVKAYSTYWDRDGLQSKHPM